MAARATAAAAAAGECESQGRPAVRGKRAQASQPAHTQRCERMSVARALGAGAAGRGGGGRRREGHRSCQLCRAAAQAGEASPQQPAQPQPPPGSLRALASNPLASAVGASAVTAFVSWLRGVGARGNEMHNLSKSFDSLKNDISSLKSDLKSDINRQTDQQQATNRNLFSLTVVSVSASVGAFIVALLKGRI